DSARPERLRDNAEHGPAVEAEQAGVDGVELVTTELHGQKRTGGRDTVRISNLAAPLPPPLSPVHSSGHPAAWPSPWESLRRRWARAARRRSVRTCGMRK